jgi:PAS domain S-box-containing protein
MKVRDEHSVPQISWKEILTSLEDGVITVDLQGKIAFFNEAAEVLTGISASQALQHSFLRVFKQDPWLVE